MFITSTPISSLNEHEHDDGDGRKRRTGPETSQEEVGRSSEENIQKFDDRQPNVTGSGQDVSESR